MARERERRDPVRLLTRRLTMLVLFALVLIGVSGVWNIYKKEQESKVLRQEAQAQLADLSARETALNAQIGNLETDRGKEAALREQYAMGKSGEGLIVIVNPPNPATSTPTSTPFETWVHDTFSWW